MRALVRISGNAREGRERQFAGIYMNDAPGFIAGQVIGAAAAIGLMKWLLSAMKE